VLSLSLSLSIGNHESHITLNIHTLRRPRSCYRGQFCCGELL
jgi:hypothetical protein